MKAIYALALILCIYACSDPIEAQAPPSTAPLVTIEVSTPAVETPEPELASIVTTETPINAVSASEIRAAFTRDDRPQTPSDSLPEPDPALVSAIKREIAINLPNGTTAPVRHCLRAGPRMQDDDRWARCERRIRLFASYFQEAGARHGVDPWLLAAIARHESGFHPMAEGSIGEYGIMQLHPRGVGAQSRYIRNPNFRLRCQHVPGACQEEVVDLGASLIGRSIQRCGNEAAALGLYNRGRCGETDYSRRIARTLARMRSSIQSESADTPPEQ